MSALSVTEKQRYQELTGNLNKARQSVKELSDGYAFRFKADSQLIQEAAEFIVYERLCCPFFTFELAVEPDANRLWLRLRGQNGIKEFIKYEFNIDE
jgi:hypothetical protein